MSKVIFVKLKAIKYDLNNINTFVLTNNNLLTFTHEKISFRISRIKRSCIQ
jgi:hypothetical protein